MVWIGRLIAAGGAALLAVGVGLYVFALLFITSAQLSGYPPNSVISVTNQSVWLQWFSIWIAIVGGVILVLGVLATLATSLLRRR